MVNPRQVRDFARAIGQLAKTDALDARMLALFGERVRPTLRALPDEVGRELKAVTARRRQVVEMLVAEQNRLGQAPSGSVPSASTPCQPDGTLRFGTSCRPFLSRISNPRCDLQITVRELAGRAALSLVFQHAFACPSGARMVRESALESTGLVSGAPISESVMDLTRRDEFRTIALRAVRAV
jgi:hypothetical protein